MVHMDTARALVMATLNPGSEFTIPSMSDNAARALLGNLMVGGFTIRQHSDSGWMTVSFSTEDAADGKEES